MKKGIKISLIIASVLVVFGLAIFITVLAVNDFSYKKLNGRDDLENKEKILTEDFNLIKISADVTDIVLIKTNDPTGKIIYQERKRLTYEINVVNDTLKIREVNTKKWHFFTNLLFEKEKMEIYLPKDTYDSLVITTAVGNIEIPKEFNFNVVNIDTETGKIQLFADAKDITIQTETGSVKLKNLNADNINIETSTGIYNLENINATNQIRLKSSTGYFTLKDVNCDSLRINTSTGRMNLTNVIATNSFNFNASTGRVIFDGCDAGEIYIKTSTGSVTGTLLTSKIFYATTENGKVDVPRTTTGGICEIQTDTGNISIRIVD